MLYRNVLCRFLGLFIVLSGCVFNMQATITHVGGFVETTDEIAQYAVKILYLEKESGKRGNDILINETVIIDTNFEDLLEKIVDFLEATIAFSDVKKKIILQSEVMLKSGIAYRIDQIEIKNSSCIKPKYHKAFIQKITDYTKNILALKKHKKLTFGKFFLGMIAGSLVAAAFPIALASAGYFMLVAPVGTVGGSAAGIYVFYKCLVS